ncbi:pseudouridine synthase [Pseudoroseicyclus sp. CXY001]|uniref:pseudouridine synthase n=1 Tax=Pseudoroseicyclus sp. CXY001 TaxID=3242492 RepID=UPI0035709BAC
MSDTPKPPGKTPPTSPDGDRIAKRLARAGVASRREAERMIAEGRVAVNGQVIDSPALNVTGRDRVTVDGKPLAEPEPARLWLYHKPKGLVTSAKDEKGRETVFDKMPEDMPRVVSVGRLDLNSEGLLLLTNDGELKRKLELPSTGWLRRYRVRVNGTVDEAALDRLRKGIEIDGERFQPMEVRLDRQQGANAWLTIGLREGKNREIRRAVEVIGLVVNRLIRISYGPFQLGNLAEGAVEEVRGRVLRDQLGEREAQGEGTAKRAGKPGGKAGGKPGKRPQRPEGKGPRGARPEGSGRRFSAGGPGKTERGDDSPGRDGAKGPRGGKPEGTGRSFKARGAAGADAPGKPGRSGGPRREGSARPEGRSFGVARPGGKPKSGPRTGPKPGGRGPKRGE